MHYRVRYSLDFDPKLRSGQVCAAINNFKATSKGFSSIVKKSSLKLRSKALEQTEKGGSNESNEISLYCSGCAAAAAL